MGKNKEGHQRVLLGKNLRRKAQTPGAGHRETVLREGVIGLCVTESLGFVILSPGPTAETQVLR